MRTGRVEEANALAQRIGKDIARRCEVQLSKVDGKVDSKGCGQQSDSSLAKDAMAE